MIVGLVCTIAIVLGFVGVFSEIIRQKMLPPERRYNGPRPPHIASNDTVADAKSLGLTTEEVQRILCKHFPYYNSLSTFQQVRFVGRVTRFIQQKLFIIKEGNGYREMPVLTSAAAIQLTFGLDDYLLPWFRYIQIYPEAFLNYRSMRVVIGNVNEHTITVAWPHFLHGYQDGCDGCNVGLHEMSHALYYQKVEIEKLDALTFCNRYQSFINLCEVPFLFEGSGKTGLYSEYGTSNMQEFWAESIELFFEKSLELKRVYPQLFDSLVELLQQNPLTKEKVAVKSLWLHKLLGIIWRWRQSFKRSPQVQAQ